MKKEGRVRTTRGMNKGEMAEKGDKEIEMQTFNIPLKKISLARVYPTIARVFCLHSFTTGDRRQKNSPLRMKAFDICAFTLLHRCCPSVKAVKAKNEPIV